MTTVICFGTFDHLHQGHLNYFLQAKELGDYLIVVVARDKNTNKETTYNENQRLKEVKQQQIVDEAVLGDLEDKYKIIKEKNPDFLCLGYDQEIDENKLKEELVKLNLFPEIKRMNPYQEDKYKSSLIRNK
ncbi:FAD synthase [Candidatus Woesearchaeota archaeon]|jgi:FAD synthetase|nr:FAD synthase [Candidatus Woesearchaeota archaeon]MBT4336040.1 FAD synthase [Candidatus Woesearchaeota archaeon]MBT4468981.1 FAD synthase [Candidatus Woesearchaeota archaeon]MBT6744700.1 FAD synthase [Candidatus Woesearchaeota archaeon]